MQITPEVQAKIDALPTAEQIVTMTEYNSKKIVDTLQCPYCSTIFNNKIQFSTHIRKAHNKTKEEVRDLLVNYRNIFLRKQLAGCINTKRTCLIKFGTTAPLLAKPIYDKARQTCLTRFGVDQCSRSQEVKKRLNGRAEENTASNTHFNLNYLNKNTLRRVLSDMALQTQCKIKKLNKDHFKHKSINMVALVLLVQ